ncbi:MAG TPA: ATPase, T2SS/T4P/T4SS family, partial [Solirubrobacteraceae bacterium]|nr:ATPase, T2SS/T4P/T4SS family [Solirubrobacteraceae bacterium]
MEIDFAEVLMEVIDRRASDLHLTAGAPPMVRVRGRLTPLEGYPALTPTDTREIVYSILSNQQRQKLENNWQIDFAYQIPQRGRFRVNAYFQRSAIGAAFRLIPFEVVPFDTLGLPAAVADFAKRPRGLVLVTGPTGSGKSTTLASLVDMINQEREEHIMTIEDPIEFLHTHKKCIVNQRELGSDATSFG